MRAMSGGAEVDAAEPEEPQAQSAPPPMRQAERVAPVEDARAQMRAAAMDIFAEMHRASMARATEKVQSQAPAEDAPKPKRRGPMTEDDLALELARQVAPPDLDGDDLKPYAQETQERLAMAQWLRTNPDHESAPAVRERLEFLNLRAHNATLERQIHDLSSKLDTALAKIGDVESAPQRKQQQQSQVERLATTLADMTQAEHTGYKSLHALAAKSPEKARKLAERLDAMARKGGEPKSHDEYITRLDQAAQELEDLYLLTSDDAPPQASARPATKVRPDVTPAASGGSPARHDPDDVKREQWEQMPRSKRRRWAMEGAEAEMRRG